MTVKTLRAHESVIHQMVLSSDGRTLVTKDTYNTIYCWDLSARDPSASATKVPANPSRNFALSADATTVALGEEDLSIWDLRIERLLKAASAVSGRSFSSEEISRYGIEMPPDAQRLEERIADTELRAWQLPGFRPNTLRWWHLDQAAVAKDRRDWPGASEHLNAAAAFQSGDQELATSLSAIRNELPLTFTDGGFEFLGVQNWIVKSQHNRVQAFMDSRQAHYGKRALRIDSPREDDIRCLQTIAVKPHTRYRLNGWVKTVDVHVTQEGGRDGACLSVDDVGISRSVVGTNDWQEVRFEFNSGEHASIEMGVRLGYVGSACTGTAWFDDLRLEQLGPE